MIQERRGFDRRVSLKEMTWNVDNRDWNLGTPIRFGRPATEDYADAAVEAIKAGRVIVVPTDTLYGFACDVCSVEAVNWVYEIKGRKYTSLLAICVGDVEDKRRFALKSHLPSGLLSFLLPGLIK